MAKFKYLQLAFGILTFISIALGITTVILHMTIEYYSIIGQVLGFSIIGIGVGNALCLIDLQCREISEDLET